MLSVVVTVAIATCAAVREARGEPLSEISPQAADHLDGFIAEASERFGIPTAWIRAIVRVEIGQNVRASPRKGGVGLSQLSPEKWTALRHRYALGDNPLDPRDNILAGTAHLREMYDRYGSKDFLAAYIIGPTRYDEQLKSGAPLPQDAQTVVAELAPLIESGLKDVVGSNAHAKAISWRKAPLFVAQTERSSRDKALAAGVPKERSAKSQTSADGSALVPRADGLFARRGMEARSQ
jgi:soluble lytic murein transglycosylase-like protein